jgi:hypothetical protein
VVHEPLTALWQPHLSPPNEWLYPAILYQDRISTIRPSAPMDQARIPLALLRPLTRSREIEAHLGALYTPTTLSRPQFANPAWLEQLIDDYVAVLRGRPTPPSDAATNWLQLSGCPESHYPRDLVARGVKWGDGGAAVSE